MFFDDAESPHDVLFFHALHDQNARPDLIVPQENLYRPSPTGHMDVRWEMIIGEYLKHEPGFPMNRGHLLQQ